MRRLAALSPDAAPIDERTVPDGLVFASKFGRLINFYNAQDRLEGDWGAFFDAQPLVQYALLAATDVATLGEEYRSVLEQLDAHDRATREVARPVALAYLLAMLCRANNAQRFFAGQPEETVFLGEVDAAIRLLYAKALRQGANALALWKTLLYEALAWKEALQAFDPALWSVGGLRPTDASPDPDADGQAPTGASPDPPPALSAAQRLEQALVRKRRLRARRASATAAMRKALWAAHGAEKALVASALLRRDQLLAHPQLLAPHFALYLNFLQQLQYARQRMNGLTGKHLDFYYGTILEESPQPPVNDSIYFAVQSDPKVGAFTVPAGARLAGQDAAGQAMLYQTDAELELSGMAVAQIATVYVSPPPTAAEQATDPALTGFYLGEVAQPAVVKGALAPAAAWAAFGEEPAGGVAAGPVTVTPATIGFALASPYLHLEEGTRTIDLSVLFDVPLAVSPPLIPLPPNTFQISYSGLTDWVALDPKKCHASTEAGVSPPAKEPAKSAASERVRLVLCLTVRAQLSPGDPACVNFNPAKLDGPFAPDWPVLRVQFPNPLAFAGQPAQAMATAGITSITLRVAAEGMTDLVLANDAGPVAPSATMLPFGAQPQPRSAFLVGKAEVFRKKFTAVRLELDWANLPNAEQYPQGWRSYYREYVYALTGLPPPPPLTPPAPRAPADLFGNWAYRVKLDFLTGGAWRPWPASDGDASHSTYALFETGPGAAAPVNRLLPGLFYTSPGEEDGALKSSTIYAIPQPALTPPAPPAPGSTVPPPTPILAQPNYRLPPLLAYTPQSTTGFFRLVFVEPEYGFGQQMYPRVASLIAMANAGVAMANAGRVIEKAERDEKQELIGIRQALDHLAEELRRRHKKKDKTTPAGPAPAPAGTRPKTAATAAPKTFFGKLFSFGTNRPPASELSTVSEASKPKPEMTSKPKPGLTPMPNPPIAPALRGVTLAYRAQTTINFDTNDEPYGFFHLAPLAAYLVAPTPPGANPSPRTLIESWIVRSSTLPPGPGAHPRPQTVIESYAAGGYLYLGLSTASLPQSVTLLAIIDEAPPADGTVALDPPAWSCLTSTGWVVQPASSIHDGTDGFLKSGLIHLALPAGMSDRTSWMTAGLFWIRAYASARNAARVMRLVPQAGSATWVSPDKAPPKVVDLHLSTPLSPGSVKAFRPAPSGVLLVEQLLPSFGARPAESGAQMQVRLSERLRHKGRAWTPWDYERLLLQEFPSIYYALCLPATKYATGAAAGHVLVLVLPALASPPQQLPPGFRAGELRQMAQWLQQRMSPSVQVEVANPDYLDIHVTATVTFAAAQSAASYTQQLNAALKAFISPWMYQPATVEGPPRQDFHRADLQAFIASRAYVKTVTDVTVDVQNKARASICPLQPWSFLITADQHTINP